MDQVTIRAARAGEAAALTELAIRAKASWGYDEAFMAACRAELTLTPEQMARWRIWVAEADALGGPAIAGMIALSLDDGAQVEDFFVAPEFQARGVGGALMAVLLEACRREGVTTLEVDADPNAEAIYARLGFTTFARSPSGSIPGRTLPRMRLMLSADAPPLPPHEVGGERAG